MRLEPFWNLEKVKKKYIAFLLGSLLLYNCNTDDPEKVYTISVDLNESSNVSIWDIFTKIELIPLETTELSLMKNIMKVIDYNDNYYVLDYRNAEILIFNSQGKFLHKISDKGVGPEEYINISDFEIDFGENKIVFLSPVNYSKYEYDLKGDFIRTYKLPETPGAYKSFLSLNKDTTVYFSFDLSNRIKLYSKKENKIIKEIFPEEENLLNNFSYYEFPYLNYFFRSSSNTLYMFDIDGSIIQGYIWDFGVFNNTKKQLNNIKKIPFNEFADHFHKLINSEIINHVPILHGGNSNYLFIQIWRKGKHINIFHNKKNNKNYVFEKTLENATFHPLTWNEDYVIGYYSDEWGKIEETIPNEILDKDNLIIKNMRGEDDNPVLIKYYFK